MRFLKYIAGAIIITVAAGVPAYLLRDKWLPLPPHKLVVKNYLNDPDSAQFRGDFLSAKDKTVWCGEVNARNRMGGMIGYTKYIVYLEEPSAPESVLNEVFVDDSSASEDPSDPTSKASVFRSKWSRFCY